MHCCVILGHFLWEDPEISLFIFKALCNKFMILKHSLYVLALLIIVSSLQLSDGFEFKDITPPNKLTKSFTIPECHDRASADVSCSQFYKYIVDIYKNYTILHNLSTNSSSLNTLSNNLTHLISIFEATDLSSDIQILLSNLDEQRFMTLNCYASIATVTSNTMLALITQNFTATPSLYNFYSEKCGANKRLFHDLFTQISKMTIKLSDFALDPKIGIFIQNLENLAIYDHFVENSSIFGALEMSVSLQLNALKLFSTEKKWLLNDLKSFKLPDSSLELLAFSRIVSLPENDKIQLPNQQQNQNISAAKTAIIASSVVGALFFVGIIVIILKKKNKKRAKKSAISTENAQKTMPEPIIYEISSVEIDEYNPYDEYLYKNCE